ncbi:hypothetical protein BU16DRAFT_531713 [Lophium mytilinum]|uniref:Uncharacterized protein n=1 Tax=Lophium mytilinum TaxID=390894 RepID=A0A6A6QBF2_9PEZI|nr:hypothetical protein BU16DRAFT_531713 [Lophium mytilinum]
MAPPIAIPQSDTTSLGAALQATLSKVVSLLSWFLGILLYIPWIVLFFVALAPSLLVAAVTMTVTGKLVGIDFLARYSFAPGFMAIWMGHFGLFLVTIFSTGAKETITLALWCQSLAVVAITLSILCVVAGALVVAGVWTARGIHFAMERRSEGAAVAEKPTED